MNLELDTFLWDVESARIRPEDDVPRTVRFLRGEECVGILYLDPPLRFEGDAEESARIFFNMIIARMEKYREKIDEPLRLRTDGPEAELATGKELHIYPRRVSSQAYIGTMYATSLEPLSIRFQLGDEEVGVLYPGFPVRFEGDIEKTTQAFFRIITTATGREEGKYDEPHND